MRSGSPPIDPDEPAGAELTFIGEEPLLVPDLAERIAAAREAGHHSIGIRTQGLHSADAETFDRLVEAGLTDVLVALHGPDSASHDYHAGHPGAFEALRRTMQLARARHVTVVATTALTRSNHSVLSSLPPLLRKAGVSAWLVTLPRAVGETEIAFDRVMPRIGLALPYVLHALSIAGRLGLPAFVQGAPMCTVGPYTVRVLPEPEKRAFHEPSCATCTARERCSGVDSTYLRRFQGDELITRQDVVEWLRPQSTREAALLRMFVGTAPQGGSAAQDAPALPSSGAVDSERDRTTG